MNAFREHQIVPRIVAWRDLDRKDIERLLLKHRGTIDLQRIRDLVKEFSDLLDAPERVSEFDALIARVARPTVD